MVSLEIRLMRHVLGALALLLVLLPPPPHAHAAAPATGTSVAVVADDPKSLGPLLKALTKALTSVTTKPVRLEPPVATGTAPPSARVVLAIGPRAAKTSLSRTGTTPHLALGLWTRKGAPKPVKGVTIGWTRSLDDGGRLLASLGGTTQVFVADQDAVVGAVEAPNAAETLAAGSAAILGPMSARVSLAKRLTARGVLVFDAVSPQLVKAGEVVAGASSKDDVDTQARWAAVQIGRILEGRKTDAVTDLRPEGGRTALNIQVAARVAPNLPLNALANARVFARAEPSDHALSLTQAVKKGLKTSLAARSSQLGITVANADVRSALANLLPQLDASLAGNAIDTDAARASNGLNPQFTMDVQATLTQLLYSEQAWMGFATSKLSRDAAKHDYATTLLDVSLQVAQAWLGVQRAGAVVDVQRRLLEVSRENLRLAQSRVKAGKGTKADILRWESQIAGDTASLMDAVLNLNTANLSLAQAMGLPPGKRLELTQPTFDTLAKETGSTLVTGQPRDLKAARRLEEGLLKQGLRADPELRRLASLKAAQNEVVAHTTRGLFVPTIAVSAGLSHRAVNAGVGAPPDVLPPGSPDNTNVFFSFNVSLPLFQGTARYATLDKARAEVQRLDAAVAARKIAVSRDMRQAYRTATTAFAKVEVQRRSVKAARESYQMNARAYARGSTGIAPVLDAQSNLQRTELALMDARFGAEDALMKVYRQLGAFYFLMSPSEQTQWQTSLKQALTPKRPTTAPNSPITRKKP